VRSYSWAEAYGASDTSAKAKWVYPERRVIAQLGSEPCSFLGEVTVPIATPVKREESGAGAGKLCEYWFLLSDVTSSSYIEVTNGFGELCMAGHQSVAGDLHREPHVVGLMVSVPTFKCELNKKFGLLTVREGAAREGSPASEASATHHWHRGLRGVYVYVTYSPAGAKDPDEQKFWKDGFTDLLGRFDYVSVSTAPLSVVSKFHLYVERDQGDLDMLTVEPPQGGAAGERS